MKQRICDICEENPASRNYKAKQSFKGFWQKFPKGGGMYQDELWQPSVDIDICEVCAKKIFNVKNTAGRKILPPKR